MRTNNTYIFGAVLIWGRFSFLPFTRPWAMEKVKKYAQQGYTHGVEVDLSQYFDTLPR